MTSFSPCCHNWLACNWLASVPAVAYHFRFFFSMLSSLCRAIASFSLEHRRHRLELRLYDLWVPKISQDMFKLFLAGLIFPYLFDSSVSVWNLMLLNVFFMFRISELKCCFTNAIISLYFRVFFVWCDTCFV